MLIWVNVFLNVWIPAFSSSFAYLFKIILDGGSQLSHIKNLSYWCNHNYRMSDSFRFQVKENIIDVDLKSTEQPTAVKHAFAKWKFSEIQRNSNLQVFHIFIWRSFSGQEFQYFFQRNYPLLLIAFLCWGFVKRENNYVHKKSGRFFFIINSYIKKY